MVPTTIQFTGEQARGLAGVTPEAWRHWRSVVPYLHAKRGKAARFSLGEIVVLSLLARAVGELGVGVKRMAAGWDQLFTLCAAERPADLRGASVSVAAHGASLGAPGGPEFMNDLALVMNCAPVVDQLTTAAFPDLEASLQRSLPFAPQLVAGASR